MGKKITTKKILSQKHITLDASKLKNISKLSKKHIQEMLNIFDTYGVVLLQVAPTDEFVAADNLRFLKKIC